ncbi:hypothetical protein AX17_006744 [Amanita inopinata Kibby_2008]|nr:hypothetical protein AX17_006744 [Amanita inopinata Kibby_2008]
MDSLLTRFSKSSGSEQLVYKPFTLSSASEVVHLEYEYQREPALPHPEGEAWTRFVSISDTHNRGSQFPSSVPWGDVLLHAGDLTRMGREEEFEEEVVKWLAGLPHKVKIVIAGNHDLPLHQEWYETDWRGWHEKKQDRKKVVEMMREAGIVYLECEEYRFRVREGGRMWSVYGSPWQPWFFDWAFNYERAKAHEIVDKFPKTDILLTHGPPHGVFDETRRGDKVGCEALAARVAQLRPRLHVFGHIHEAHGAYIHTWDPDSPVCPSVQNYQQPEQTEEIAKAGGGGNTVFVNASNTAMGRRAIRDGGRLVPFGGPGFQPVIVDLKDSV